MREVTYFECERCKRCWETKDLAAQCESAQDPAPPPVVVGGEVKLKNRHASYTVAKVTGLRLGALAPGLPGGHQWLLELDREVYLDHASGGLSRIQSARHLLSEEQANALRRRDNCASC